MEINKEGLELIKSFEGCRLTAYRCPAGVWTIGYGNTFYESGMKVKEGDTITQERAEELFANILQLKFVEPVRRLLRQELNNNQFSAIVSFAYNLGTGNLKSSTLLKKVNTNPEDQSIRTEFGKWVYAGGKVLKGLVRRRQAEADLYFKN